jgi:hypothetical protein
VDGILPNIRLELKESFIQEVSKDFDGSPSLNEFKIVAKAFCKVSKDPKFTSIAALFLSQVPDDEAENGNKRVKQSNTTKKHNYGGNADLSSLLLAKRFPVNASYARAKVLSFVSEEMPSGFKLKEGDDNFTFLRKRVQKARIYVKRKWEFARSMESFCYDELSAADKATYDEEIRKLKEKAKD